MFNPWLHKIYLYILMVNKNEGIMSSTAMHGGPVAGIVIGFIIEGIFRSGVCSI
jgi:hypothetical protein